MWTRALLKENAKIAFKRNYWTCVFASVILMLLGAGAETSSFSLNLNTNASSSNIIYDITGRDFMILLMILLNYRKSSPHYIVLYFYVQS